MLSLKSLSRIATTIAISGAMLTSLAGEALAQMLLSEGGFLNPGTSVEHYFQGQAGQDIDVQLQSADFDTYLTVYAPNGQLIGENDDADETLNSRVNARLSRSGSYRVVVEGFDFNQRGRYRLTVNGISQPPAPAEVLGERGFLQAGRYVEHYFQGSAGQTITISANSNDFDTYLAVYDPNNRLIAENDDDGGTLNSRLSLTLPSSGQYRLLVQGYSSADAGRYNISVNQ